MTPQSNLEKPMPSPTELVILDPRSTSTLSMQAVRPTWRSLQDRTVGIIDNTKPNMDLLSRSVVETLQSRHGAARLEYRRKRSATGPADSKVYDDMAKLAHIVITGSGD